MSLSLCVCVCVLLSLLLFLSVSLSLCVCFHAILCVLYSFYSFHDVSLISLFVGRYVLSTFSVADLKTESLILIFVLINVICEGIYYSKPNSVLSPKYNFSNICMVSSKRTKQYITQWKLETAHLSSIHCNILCKCSLCLIFCQVRWKSQFFFYLWVCTSGSNSFHTLEAKC